MAILFVVCLSLLKLGAPMFRVLVELAGIEPATS